VSDALIGYSGFVGGTLLRQRPFDALYNSKNIDDVIGHSFGTLVVSAMPAAKWIANRDPAGDRAVLDRLGGCLRQVQAKRVIVMSTVDVYPAPVGVDEETPIDEAAQQPYGRHRLMLERMVANHFPRVLVVRLPGLYGAGLKKNAVYDLLHNNDVQKIHSGGVFQFYNLDRLWADVQTAESAGLALVNFATEPVSMRDVAGEAFDIEFDNDTGQAPVRYDMRSQHAGVFGGRDGYLFNRRRVLDELRAFVRREREALGE
jgi:nucleoside-diphosphate-sugar epimerase